MSDVLKDISNSMAEQFDNNFAKAFAMQAGNALIRNGIKVWYYQKIIDSKIEEKENEVTYKDTYAIYFDRVDTSEHDAKVRADAIDDAIKKLAESEDTILTDKQYYTLMELKEQKNE